MDGIWRVRVAVLPSVKRFSPRTLLVHLKLLSALEWSLRPISGGQKGESKWREWTYLVGAGDYSDS